MLPKLNYFKTWGTLWVSIRVQLEKCILGLQHYKSVTNISRLSPILSHHHDDGTNNTVPMCMKIIPHTNNLTRTIPWLHVFWMTSPHLDLFHKSFLTDFEVETKQKSKKNSLYQGRRYCHDNPWFCEFIRIHTKIKFWNYSL